MTGKQRGGKIRQPGPPTTTPKTSQLSTRQSDLWTPQEPVLRIQSPWSSPAGLGRHAWSLCRKLRANPTHSDTRSEEPPVPPFSLLPSSISPEDSLQLGLTAMPFSVTGGGCDSSCRVFISTIRHRTCALCPTERRRKFSSVHGPGFNFDE